MEGLLSADRGKRLQNPLSHPRDAPDAGRVAIGKRRMLSRRGRKMVKELGEIAGIDVIAHN